MWRPAFVVMEQLMLTAGTVDESIGVQRVVGVVVKETKPDPRARDAGGCFFQLASSQF